MMGTTSSARLLSRSTRRAVDPRGLKRPLRPTTTRSALTASAAFTIALAWEPVAQSGPVSQWRSERPPRRLPADVAHRREHASGTPGPSMSPGSEPERPSRCLLPRARQSAAAGRLRPVPLRNPQGPWMQVKGRPQRAGRRNGIRRHRRSERSTWALSFGAARARQLRAAAAISNRGFGLPPLRSSPQPVRWHGAR